jgi:hypothetical protein
MTQRVVASALGYQFRFSVVDAALRDLLSPADNDTVAVR